MRSVMRHFKEESIFYLFLVFLFILLSTLSYFLMEAGRQNIMLRRQYDAFETVAPLVESYFAEGGIDESLLTDRVLGFGIYDTSGRSLERWGTGPEELTFDEEKGKPPQPIFEVKRQSIVMVRRVGVPDLTRPRPTFEPRSAPSPRILYLELYSLEFWRSRGYLRLAFIMALLIIALFVITIRYLYRRNMKYKREAQAQRHLASLGEVARTLSHEIKNPLSAIKLQAGILKKSQSEESQEVMIIEEEVERLNLLVNRIGEFLKNPGGNPEVIDAHPFIEDLLARFSGKIHYENPGSSRAYTRFDRQRFRSVLENLFMNALESGSKKVEVKLFTTRREVDISILDRGKGLPEGKRDAVFDPFFTTKTRGSGIGLAISKRFIEAAGGSLYLSPREGGGVEAKITLKREEP